MNFMAAVCMCRAKDLVGATRDWTLAELGLAVDEVVDLELQASGTTIFLYFTPHL
jgi:hypothetical protein